jgi:hypothetical protein
MRTALALILAAIFLILMPALSPAEVRVTLKNGRSFFADDCRPVNGKYLCDMAGGTIEFDKKEIASMKEVNIPRRPVLDTQPEASNEADPGKKVSDGEKASQEKTPAKDNGERGVSGLDSEQAKQLDQIDAIKKRIADLERRINGFNEAVKKLNLEEERILKR